MNGTSLTAVLEFVNNAPRCAKSGCRKLSTRAMMLFAPDPETKTHGELVFSCDEHAQSDNEHNQLPNAAAARRINEEMGW